MKANELRLGNLMSFGSMVCKVVEIHEDFYYVEADDKEVYKNLWADIQPIPLTEEWLLKFGFKIVRQTKEENNIWRCQSSECHFELEQIRGFFLSDNSSYGTEVKYVHQLQNLYFALTGNELVKQ